MLHLLGTLTFKSIVASWKGCNVMLQGSSHITIVKRKERSPSSSMISTGRPCRTGDLPPD
ncbi:hypothetical protein HOLleu_25300 [Holothuria leucospilota]|uniref:Uncharacterized protein n=1 Tax=Holothuria leucospilota TaxID=206669 RepID=A0A9Q1BSD0_HOLLE|nr:hypothetical protein HOLleu_25300 [Holothuria leucospilota]